MKKVWTRKEDYTLRTMSGRFTYKEIGEKLNRTRASVLGRSNFLGLALMNCSYWTEERKRMLKRMHEYELSSTQIAHVLGTNVRVVSEQKSKQKISKHKVYTKDQIRHQTNFIQKSRTKTAAEIMRSLKIGKHTLIKRIKEMGHNSMFDFRHHRKNY